MGLYTKISKQVDIFCEVVSINKILSEQNIYLKNLVLLFCFFLMYIWLLGEIFNLTILLSPFFGCYFI